MNNYYFLSPLFTMHSIVDLHKLLIHQIDLLFTFNRSLILKSGKTFRFGNTYTEEMISAYSMLYLLPKILILIKKFENIPIKFIHYL